MIQARRGAARGSQFVNGYPDAAIVDSDAGTV
jgi:hypothetical protein